MLVLRVVFILYLIHINLSMGSIQILRLKFTARMRPLNHLHCWYYVTASSSSAGMSNILFDRIWLSNSTLSTIAADFTCNAALHKTREYSPFCHFLSRLTQHRTFRSRQLIPSAGGKLIGIECAWILWSSTTLAIFISRSPCLRVGACSPHQQTSHSIPVFQMFQTLPDISLI